MSESESTAREIIRFAGAKLPASRHEALFTNEAAAGRRPVPRGQGFVRIVLVHREQAALAVPPNKHHGAAGAFALPAVTLERREPGGESAAQIGAGRQLGGVEHVVE